MSIVYVGDDHDESIYAIGERIDEAPEVRVEKKYRSRHSAAIRNEKHQLKTYKKHATMGPAIVAAPQPEEFLRKRTGGRQSASSRNSGNRRSCCLSGKRPEVPLKGLVINEQDGKLRRQSTDFVSENVKAVERMVRKKPQRKIVVDANGKTVSLGDGIRPKYIYSENFGNPPKYIRKFRDRMVTDKTTKLESIKETMKLIDRDRILAGLKENWADLQKEFQKLPLLIDTMPKILRKQKLEDAIKEVEKDILLLERHSKVYVYDDTKKRNRDDTSLC